MILPAVLIETTLVTWGLTVLMADRVRVRQEWRKPAALSEWENEGGRVVAPVQPSPGLARRARQ